MPGKITLEAAPPDSECVICPNPAAFRITLGAGYREPSDLCGNCTAFLRVTLGPSNLAKAQFAAWQQLASSADREWAENVIRLFRDNAERNTEGVE